MRPHGVRGEVVVELVSNRPGRLSPGSCLSAAAASNPAPTTLEVRHARPAGGGPATARAERLGHPVRWLVSFVGVEDRATADYWRGALLLGDPPEDGERLWVHRLVGRRAVTPGGELLGRVTAVEANPAADLLVLDRGGLVPLSFVRVEGWEGEDDLTVDAPPGLLDR